MLLFLSSLIFWWGAKNGDTLVLQFWYKKPLRTTVIWKRTRWLHSTLPNWCYPLTVKFKWFNGWVTNLKNKYTLELVDHRCSVSELLKKITQNRFFSARKKCLSIVTYMLGVFKNKFEILQIFLAYSSDKGIHIFIRLSEAII